MQTKTRTKGDTTRARWLALLDELFHDIASWSEEQEWLVHRDTKKLEEPFGTYQAPYLAIRTPQGRFVVNPIARFVMAADGRVDMEAWPSFDRVAILRERGQWKVRRDSAFARLMPWNRQNFLRLVRELVSD